MAQQALNRTSATRHFPDAEETQDVVDVRKGPK
jgi:hypothetical protein